MDFEGTCHDLKELGVIDEKMLMNAIIEQGPKGEEGRLFKEQEINYEEITHLRLEYFGILKIDHLWMMTGLTKLQLSNNSIEKIENLHFLVNLKELNLSFNFIERIENLEKLSKLEVLSLYQNKIEKLENLDNLSSLTVFSIGNNKIKDYENVLYLRNFNSLKCFNMAGNPICRDENFTKFIFAYLPQLKYYEYRLISTTEKNEARDLFLNDLVKLEREEDELRKVKIAQEAQEKQEEINAKAFVEYLGENQLFLSLFEKDSDCQTLLKMGDAVLDIYNEYEKNFTEVTKELQEFGLAQSELRKAEIERFEKFVGAAKEKAFKESREVTENFLEERNVLFSQIKQMLNVGAEDENEAGEVSYNVQVISESFRELCHKTWTVLMKKELNLFEAIEEVNSTFERSLTEMVNQFIEGAQAQFTQLRQLQNTFHETLTDVANKFFTNYTVSTATGGGHEFKNLPKDLVNMMQEKDILTNALSASHDYHLLVIDQREDKLVSGIKNWLSNLVNKLYDSEMNRNRSTVMEINHFLDTQKLQMQEILSTPLGLLLLPKEVQDALQA